MADRDLTDLARTIIDANVYLTMATVDRDGLPWAAPVFFAARDYREYYWMSSPDATHSRNLAGQPRVSIVVFDSRQPPGTGHAVYLSAAAEEVDEADLDRALGVYPGPADRGGKALPADDFRAPAPWRLYRATATGAWVLCPRQLTDAGERICARHGRAYDHRTEVTLFGG